MAVLQKIRNRSGLLIAIIAFALFAFVVGDLFNSGNIGRPSKDVGSVNGKDIPFEDFKVKVANTEKNQQNGQSMTSMQASNQVWNQEVSIALLTAEFEKLGIRVGEKHIIEVFKADPNIGQNQMFLNAAGKFDLIKFKDYFKANPEGIQYLKEREKDADLNAKYQIYNSLVKGGLYTTQAEGKLKYEMEASKVSFDFVNVPYTSIKDSDVKISDDEIKGYMKTKEKKFKSEEAREIEYVMIDEKPSAEDEAEIKNKVESLLSPSITYNNATGKNDTIPGFANTKNVAEFVNANSDRPFDSTYVSKQDLPAESAEMLFNLPTGQVSSPYMYNGYYCISKALGRKAGAKAKASHILISWEGTQVPNKKEVRTKEQAKAKAEGLLAQAKANPGNFFMLALTNSDDSSAQSGGDLGYFSPGQMVKPFNDFVFNNPIGKIGMVETEFGYHIINVTDKQDAVKLATIAQKIQPSELTNNKIYEQATKFEMDAASKDFAALAKEMKLTVSPAVRVKAVDESFGAVSNQRQIVKWAFSDDTKVGDVKRFEIVNKGHIIVKLKKVYDKGLMPVEDARPQVESILKNKKKAEMIKAKMKGASLEAIASANKVTVMNAVDMSIENPSIPNAGYEPKVVGTALASKVGQMSKPIDGNSGVYVIVTKAETKAPAIQNYDEYVNKLKQQVASYSGRVIQALKENADIEDNRAEFY
ncbi:peptidylprolyl isomerase [Flavobacterium capsici]|uniref:Periplasmic chaperone PpiD n=1 Tax=Flavobacterium capsici TaxID=3075618 RepID=A0AA96EZ80_9FLAO|nr:MULTISPECIES: peptidylprolyl isomerase [unclassified Flavobacterium]WNM19973.1 peptidylprolyl isomerase [Flavobacterium sp. PMR2A8]WNM21362.1 peptidylprolyl isomerase [Flavobacterium sp. PMTSA4]